METIYDVDQIAPWRNDPAAVSAHRAMREWHVLDRKEQAVAITNKSTVKAKQAVIIAYGLALIEGRKRYKPDKDFHHWIEVNELIDPPFNDPKERSNAMRIAGLGTSLNLDQCPYSWPSHIVKWARKTGLIQPKKRNGATAAARSHVRKAVAEGKPINRPAVSQETGASDGAVNLAVAMERARLEGIEEGKAMVFEPRFNKAQQHQVEAAINAKTKELIREHNERVRELEKQFEAAVEARFQERKAVAWPALEKEKQTARETKARYQMMHDSLINGYKPIFSKAEYIDILFCARNDHVAQDKHHRATLALEAKKLQLTGEK